MTEDAHDDTRLAHAGRDSAAQQGAVNPPVVRASTVLFPNVAALEAASAAPFKGLYYGRYGTPTHFAFCDALTELEGGAGTITACSGLAAISTALLACLKNGDHLLVSDSVYAPTRKLCEGLLASLNIETTYYDPCIGAGIEALFRANTRAVFLESPGSLTFEVQDLPAIASVARAREIAVLIDNTWATPLALKPLKLGADIVIHAATKYIVGHADAMLGAIVANERWFPVVRKSAIALGQCAGPDDVYLGLRGLRTLGVRLRQHAETALLLAKWFQQQREVERVLYPPLEEDAGHILWCRDFTGASGLFGVVLRDSISQPAVNAFCDALKLFGLGYSWGGFESLILPTHPTALRSAKRWRSGPCLRVHAGLEDARDLIADLELAAPRLRARD